MLVAAALYHTGVARSLWHHEMIPNLSLMTNNRTDKVEMENRGIRKHVLAVGYLSTSYMSLIYTCCFKFLTRNDTVEWWAALSDSHQWLSPDNFFTHNCWLAIGLYELHSKWICFCSCIMNCSYYCYNVQCFPDTSDFTYKVIYW